MTWDGRLAVSISAVMTELQILIHTRELLCVDNAKDCATCVIFYYSCFPLSELK